MASSTSARSPKSRPKTSLASPSATSSPGSASGPSASDAPAGPTIDLFGPVPVPAAHLAPPDAAAASRTSATFGRNGFGSSASAGLTSSLANSLIRRSRGSILFSLTWKAAVTPSGRLFYLLRASAAPTSAIALGSWPTPTTPSGGQTVPPGTTVSGRRPNGSKATVTLEMAARSILVSGWPTCRASDGDKNIRTMAGVLSEVRRKGGPQDLGQAAMLIGFDAQMSAGARLNPAHARWLMRIPPVWDACAVTAMRSTSRRSRS